MAELYNELLLDHYHLPRNRGRLQEPTLSTHGVNALCGDELTLDLKFDSDRLTAIAFHGHGCAISQASASMLTEIVQNKSIAELERLATHVREFLRDGNPPEAAELGDLLALEGVAKLPVRVKCAALPWTTLEQALQRLKDGQT